MHLSRLSALNSMHLCMSILHLLIFLLLMLLIIEPRNQMSVLQFLIVSSHSFIAIKHHTHTLSLAHITIHFRHVCICFFSLFSFHFASSHTHAKLLSRIFVGWRNAISKMELFGYDKCTFSTHAVHTICNDDKNE